MKMNDSIGRGIKQQRQSNGERNPPTTLRTIETRTTSRRSLVAASAATLAVASSITLLLPRACGHVLDTAVLSSSSTDSHFNSFEISAGLFAPTCTAGLGVALRTTVDVAGNRIVCRIRRRLFASIVSREAAFFDSDKSGGLISRPSNDACFVENATTAEAASGPRGALVSVGSASPPFCTSPAPAAASPPAGSFMLLNKLILSYLSASQYALEATSALDARSEHHINQALKTMAKGRTVISIAHRLSTIKESDRVAMLKGGAVVEFGTFAELIESKGAFHKLAA